MSRRGHTYFPTWSSTIGGATVPRLSEAAERFERFHNDNPEVLDRIHEIALDLRLNRGFQRCSMTLIFERLRWLHALETHGEEDFLLNNNYKPYYARVLMAMDPRLDGFFELRPMGDEYQVDSACLERLGLL